ITSPASKRRKTMKYYPNIKELERIHGVSWHDLVQREPALEDLLWVARRLSISCRRWSDLDRVFAPVLDELIGLFGLHGKLHRDPILGRTVAYEIAYGKLYDAVAGLLPGRADVAEKSPEDQREGTTPEPCPSVPVTPVRVAS